ncbi:MAG: hypothetical protein WCP93_01210 [Candidatus Berkelbacteria bacterium]
MKQNLVKLAFALVLMLAVIMPQMTKANTADTLNNIAGGIYILNTLADMGRDTKTEKALSDLRLTADPMCVRRVVIDETAMNFTGTYGEMLQGTMAARLRNVTSKSGKVAVVIGPNDMEFMANLQDTVSDSGRYTKETTAEIERGGWLAPTDVMKLTASAEIVYTDGSGAIITNSTAVVTGRLKANAVVRLYLEPISIKNGVYTSYEGVGKVQKTLSFNINGIGSDTFGSVNNDKIGLETEMVFQAATQALTSLVNQLEVPLSDKKVCVNRAEGDIKVVQAKKAQTSKSVKLTGEIGVDLPSHIPTTFIINEKTPVGVGDEIFVLDSQNIIVGILKVTEMAGRNIRVKLTDGIEPVDGTTVVVQYPK